MMTRVLNYKCAFALVGFLSNFVSSDTMASFQAIADILPEPPREVLSIKYGSNELKPGTELTPTQVKDAPTVSWSAESGAYYTLLFTDLDVSSFPQFNHWLVVDIPGSDIASGKSVYGYIGSGPPEGTGLHRYVFILYKQLAKLGPNVTEKFKDEQITERGQFNLSAFVKDNGLEGPIAANFYVAQYDDSVPQLFATIKKKYNI